MKISILGGGSWGTAMAYNLSHKHDVIMYIRNKENACEINDHHENKRYLPGYILPDNISATSNIEEVLGNKIIINAIPTQNIRSMLEQFSDKFKEDSIIVNLSKGIEKSTSKRISEIFKEYLPNNTFAALSGPSHAEEVIIDSPTSIVVACEDEDVAKFLQKELSTDNLRIYTNTDVVGVEFGGAVKNVLALGIGMIDGLGFGDNPKAAMMTRGIHEMVRFCMEMGGDRNTLYGLAGLGDLIVTATSRHSRNRKAGELIGKGHTVDQLENEINMVVEGIPTTKALKNISEQRHIYMPITNIIYKILYENLDLAEATAMLMQRAKKDEFDF
ncbi:MAG: NAD(P)-dependent glycerol-3-phosphate dehydrogenase [Tissierellia bacterium]|nr:NAD(P)-dependent glycerol-3-phosphate dehydrogenase [Tissierellia bacterium]